MASSRSWIEARVWLTLALGLRVLATWFAHQLGFSAISDDDYARVAIAQTFSHDPRWDPSGTSWLPFPFWLTGTVMWVWSSDWLVAKGVAWVTSLGSVVLFYGCGHSAGLRGFWLGLGTCLFAVLPHAVWLGSATVPDGYTAVLTLVGVCTVAASRPKQALGVSCLLIATLSRYETWPVALIVAGYHCIQAYCSTRAPEGSGRWHHVWLSLACVAGPLAWMAHGLFHHGDALFFVKRVADYRAALGSSPKTWLAILTNYPKALLAEEPLLTALFVVSATWARSATRRSGARATMSRSSSSIRQALLWASLAQLVFLVWGDVTNGAPTHHPERTLLTCWLAALIWSLQALQLAGLEARSSSGGHSPVPTLRLLPVLAGSCLVGSGIWWMLPGKHFADRSAELTLGRQLGGRLDAQSRLFIETEGYGYIAVSVGTGRPAWVDGSNPLDPRQAGSGAPWSETAALGTFLRDRQIAFVVAPASRWKSLTPLTVAEANFGSSKIFRTQWSIPEENSEFETD